MYVCEPLACWYQVVNRLVPYGANTGGKDRTSDILPELLVVKITWRKTFKTHRWWAADLKELVVDAAGHARTYLLTVRT